MNMIFLSCTQTTLQQIYHLFWVLKLKPFYIKLDLFNEPLEDYTSPIMKPFSMAWPKKTLDASTSTYYAKIMAHKEKKYLALELRATSIQPYEVLFRLEPM
jgi:hypothetical protein